MFDRWRRALDLQEQQKIAAEVQQYIADTALYMAICGNPIVNTIQADVKGFTYMRGLLVMFERTWLDRP
jgi:ABC-type transport system substrate-binding protein